MNKDIGCVSGRQLERESEKIGTGPTLSTTTQPYL